MLCRSVFQALVTLWRVRLSPQLPPDLREGGKRADTGFVEGAKLGDRSFVERREPKRDNRKIDFDDLPFNLSAASS